MRQAPAAEEDEDELAAVPRRGEDGTEEGAARGHPLSPAVVIVANFILFFFGYGFVKTYYFCLLFLFENCFGLTWGSDFWKRF